MPLSESKDFSHEEDSGTGGLRFGFVEGKGIAHGFYDIVWCEYWFVYHVDIVMNVYVVVQMYRWWKGFRSAHMLFCSKRILYGRLLFFRMIMFRRRLY